MANNLNVSITADVTDLVVKSAVAKAEAQALTAEFNKVARATASGALDAGGSAKLNELAGAMLQARP